jgi:hypothetical protein
VAGIFTSFADWGGNWGLTSVDLSAPSGSIPTTFIGNTFGVFNRVSGATPHVTGVAALLRSLHPDGTTAQIKAQILSTVDPLPSLAGKTVTGGRLNAANALGYEPPLTKFYVVNDVSSGQTYEYQTAGQFITANRLGNDTTAPRGAASAVAGDKVWVVDANKKVYVYNPSGSLLGSWSLGSLNTRADVQGIATNGTDVWVVDANTGVNAMVDSRCRPPSQRTLSVPAGRGHTIRSEDTVSRDMKGVSHWFIGTNDVRCRTRSRIADEWTPLSDRDAMALDRLFAQWESDPLEMLNAPCRSM